MTTTNQHFELHFQASSYVHYHAKEDIWAKATHEDLSLYRGSKRIQYNTEKYKKYIIVDIDDEKLFLFENTKLPKPNFILKNRDKIGGHLFYVLDRTITHEYYTKLWREVQKYFNLTQGGDPKNVGFIGKNVNNSKDFEYIEVEPCAYNINFLHDFIQNDTKNVVQNKKLFSDLRISKPKIQKQLINTTSRNVDLFNDIRTFAYKMIKKSHNDEDFCSIVALQATKMNLQYIYPMKSIEVNGIVKSISKWCIKNKSKIKNYKKVGVMNLDANIDQKSKEKMGAAYSAKAKKSKTELKIQVACIEMKSKNIKVNVSNVAKYTNLSRPTITKYKKLFI